MNNFQDKLNKLREDFEALVNSPFLNLGDVKELKKVTGVYLVYFEDKVIYVGSTNNFNVRFGINLKHISTHTLYKKLFREYLNNEGLFCKIKEIKKTKVEIIKKNLTKEEFQQFNEAKKKTESFFENECRYKIKECEDKVQAECLEHFAIWVFEPKYNNHFYKKHV